MTRRLLMMIGPSILVLAIGFAFARLRLKLDKAESVSRVERKAGELNRAALTCLSGVSERLQVARDTLPDLSAQSISQAFRENLAARQRCESALFVAAGRELTLSVPPLAKTKYADLPVWSWGPAAGASLLPVMDGPYENASQDWYVIVRVPYRTGEWIASVVPLSLLFDQLRLKEIVDLGAAIRVSDKGGNDGKEVALFSLGTAPFSPLVRHELPIRRNSILLEFSPGVDSLLRRSGLVYGSLVLIVALSVGVFIYEINSEQGRLKAEIQRRDTSIRDIKSQLNQVMRDKGGAESLAIGSAYQDVVTGLPNWLYFIKHIERSLQRSGSDEGMTVVLTEFDHLPSLQRSLDAAGIEDLLKKVVKRFEERLRPEHLMATRLGQGEFAFLIYNSGDEKAEASLLDQLADALDQPFTINEQTVILNLRAGTANSRSYPDTQQLIQHAETELLKGKLTGAEGQSAANLLAASVPRDSKELADIKTAIDRDQLRLDYLPIVSLESRSLLGLEVLVRWHHPFKGIIAPARFIPLAEASGQGVFLTKWVLTNSVQQLAAWRKSLQGVDDVFISINLTPQEFGRAGFRSLLDALLEETGVPANRLQLELDEEILGGDVRLAVDLTQRLQQMGIKLVFEEFGAARSALSSLRLVKWNFVKVARRYGEAFTEDNEHGRTLRAITHMSQDLGIDCIATGIETEPAFQQFSALGYKYGQGFLFHKPMPAQSVEAILKKRATIPS